LKKVTLEKLINTTGKLELMSTKMQGLKMELFSLDNTISRQCRFY